MKNSHCIQRAAVWRSLLAFLPHILDSGTAGRQRYLGMLRDLAAKYRERPFGFLWAQGSAQPALEASLEVGGCAARHLTVNGAAC